MTVILDFFKSLDFRRAALTIFTFVICLLVIKLFLFSFDKIMKKSKVDHLVYKIIRIILKLFLLFTTLIITLTTLGVSVSSLITALSVIGVAFSLAIQDFLSNVFGGVQIITNRPFKTGDYVEAGGEAGIVREVGLFYTKLDTPDRKLVQIPNSKIVGNNITNYSAAPIRRVDFAVCIAYEDDSEKVMSVLLELIKSCPLVLDEEGMRPVAHIKEFRDNAICYSARAWCEGKNYWKVYYHVMDNLKPTLEANGIHFTYPHVNVHMISE